MKIVRKTLGFHLNLTCRQTTNQVLIVNMAQPLYANRAWLDLMILASLPSLLHSGADVYQIQLIYRLYYLVLPEPVFPNGNTLLALSSNPGDRHGP